MPVRSENMSNSQSAANHRYYIKHRDRIRAYHAALYRAKLGGMTKRERKQKRGA